MYCLTVRDVENVAAWLVSQGIDAEPYFGSLADDARLEVERRLQSNDLKVVVATTALGMGYDKPDLSFVVHFQSPGSPVAYYQQVGRAGRALATSRGILLRGIEDEQIQDFFIDTAFASEELVNDVVRAFDHFDGPVSLIRIQNRLNVRAGVLELIVKQLDVDGVLERVAGTSYQRTFQPYTYPSERIVQVTEARRAEQQSMVDYFDTATCRMRYIATLLDDPGADDCGVCDNCTGDKAEAELPVERVAEAEEFLRHRPIVISARKQRYDEMAGKRSSIPSGERIEDGRALAYWGDSGWGQLVRHGKQVDGTFDQRLVEAMADMVRAWQPDPFPDWVTCVPSLRHPNLVPAFARSLAAALGLPYLDVIDKVADRPPQKLQENSAHQQSNVEGAFRVVATPPAAPVLLVDDIVDSCWTVTEVGRLLRLAGAGPVYPVALASSAGRDT